MRLKLSELENKQQWENNNYELPQFDINKMIEKTKKNPEWIHFGAGNIFRAFPAVICQDLLNRKIIETGIIVAEGYDYEIIEKSIKNYDNLHISVTLKADGNADKKVIASIAEALCADTENTNDWKRLKEIFSAPTLKMVSFTITEKGYNLKDTSGNYIKDVSKDFKNNPDKACSYIGKLAALCYTRFKSGKLPLTFVSMDNCSHNGSKLEQAIYSFAENWVENGITEKEFIDYVKYDISYPWTMIDKITPRPSDTVIKLLEKTGLEDSKAIVTSKNTYTALFVNAEQSQYLVIEDNFKNGKIPLDKSGTIYTDRNTVDKVEKMKVCTCLNPLHTSLAIFGCLLGYTKISEEMKDSQLISLIKNVGYKEGLPVVINPDIISPKDFIDETINIRFPNPFIPDAPQRIACDTSQKLGIRFGETIKAYIKSDKLSVTDLEYIPLVIAGWCRYLMAIDDNGEKFDLSPDPLLLELTKIIDKIEFGKNENVHETLSKILSNKSIFGLNLYDAGIGEKIEKYFKELNKGKKAVRETLTHYCS